MNYLRPAVIGLLALASLLAGQDAPSAAAAVLPPAADGKGETARAGLSHYIVFEIGQDGVIRPLYHRVVRPAARLVSLTPNEVATRLALPGRNIDRLTVRLETGAGRVVYQNVVDIPRWLRGEFHGPGPGAEIDGHIFPLERTTFVIRVPVIAGTRLHLQGRSGPGASFDPAALAADASLPLADSALEATELSGPPAGDPANRMDLLIMGDGYTDSESAKFAADAAAVADNFFNLSPYAEYKNYVNIHTLFTPSTESGADHPPYVAGCSVGDLSCCGDSLMQSDQLAGTFVATAFHSAYCTQNIHRLLTVNTSAVFAAAAEVPDWEQILVIVNDTTYGGSGGIVAAFSMHSLAVNIAQHEYGHSFTGLADEYDTPFPGFPACGDIKGSPCEPNVTDQTNRALIKWAPWILEETPVPTPEDVPQYASAVGLFEGARYLTTGMYRSGDYCLMRALGKPFCEVPSQAYVLRLYEGGWGVPASGIDMIEPGSENPAPGNVSTPFPGSVTFTVGLLGPVGGPPLEVKWYVDGVLDAAAQSNSYTFVPGGPGSFEIRLEVADTTPLVHPAMAGTSLQSSRIWNVGPDGDDDGVPDSGDLCAGTAFGATVDAIGCSDAQVDADGDGVCNPGAPSAGPSGCQLDPADNCPAWANAGQALPPWPVPEDDPDCDGWSSVDEGAIGTDPNLACSTDNWPPDFNDSLQVDIFDVLFLAPPVFFSTPPGPPYDARLDLNADGIIIDIFDVLTMAPPIFFASCTP